MTSSPTILGIDPGARQIGISVLKNKEIVFYAVKTFKRRTAPEKLQQLRIIINKLIVDYQVEYVALEKVVFVQQHRSFVKIVYEEIRDLLKKQTIEFTEYNPKHIRARICGNEKPTKRNTALILAQKHAELVRYFNVPRLWQKRYFAQLFDAVAVALVCAEEFQESRTFLSKSTISDV